jgi:hypothetical protein
MSGVARVDAGGNWLGFVPPKLAPTVRGETPLRWNRSPMAKKHQKSDVRPFFSQSP